jgi:hypothetical protein
VLAAGGLDPVDADPAEGDHAGAVAHVRLQRRQFGQRPQVLLGQLGTGG